MAHFVYALAVSPLILVHPGNDFKGVVRSELSTAELLMVCSVCCCLFCKCLTLLQVANHGSPASRSPRELAMERLIMRICCAHLSRDKGAATSKAPEIFGSLGCLLDGNADPGERFAAFCRNAPALLKKVMNQPIERHNLCTVEWTPQLFLKSSSPGLEVGVEQMTIDAGTVRTRTSSAPGSHRRL
jgi:hypothetical protein